MKTHKLGADPAIYRVHLQPLRRDYMYVCTLNFKTKTMDCTNQQIFEQQQRVNGVDKTNLNCYRSLHVDVLRGRDSAK